MQAPDRLLYHGWDSRLYTDDDIIDNYPFFEFNAPYPRHLRNSLRSAADRPDPMRYAQARDLHDGSAGALQFSFGDSRKTMQQQIEDRRFVNSLWLQTTIESKASSQAREEWLEQEVESTK